MSAYERARQSGESSIAWIDDRPYLPQLEVVSSVFEPDDDDDNTTTTTNTATLTRAASSIQEAAFQILMLHYCCVWKKKKMSDSSVVTSAATIKNNTEYNKNNIICAKQQQQSTTSAQAASFAQQLLRVERISGGRTNTLYKVSGLWNVLQSLKKEEEIVVDEAHYRKNGYNNKIHHDHDDNRTADDDDDDHCWLPDSVVVRVFGADGLINRDIETSHFAILADSNNIAPPYWGRFCNGRVEGYLDNMRALQTYELPQWAPAIARALARLHNVSIPVNDDENNETSTLWAQLDDWLVQAERVTFLPGSREHGLWENLQIATTIRSEIDWLKNKIPPSQSCFCHNDLLAANIMVKDVDDDSHSVDRTDPANIQLIDFEYGGMGFPAFDVANHFNEYAGGPPDHAAPDYDLLPSNDERHAFVRSYLLEASAAGDDGTAKQQKHQEHTNGIVPTTNEKLKYNNNDVDSFFRQVQWFLLVNHLYWGLWAVNQAATEGCDEYDYMLYAVNRIRQYWITKDELQFS